MHYSPHFGKHTTGLLLAFSAGVICLRVLPSAAMFPLIGSGLLVFGACITFCCWRGWPGRRWRCATMILLAALSGLLWAMAAASWQLARLLPVELQKRDVEVVGKIAGNVVQTSQGSRFEIVVEDARQHGKAIALRGRIRLASYNKALAPASGEQWQLIVRLKRPHGAVNPGATFLYESWLFQRRIIAAGYVRGGNRLESSNRGVDTLRQGFADFLQEQVPDKLHAALLSALAVGQRDNLTDATWQLLQDTGTVHLMAISGLHVGLVALLFGGLCSWLWRVSAYPVQLATTQTIAVIGGLSAGLGYALLAGLPLPTQRALYMLAVLALVLVLRRPGRGWQLLVLVLAVVLVLDPLAPLAISFWLSFGAVCVLTMMAIALHRRHANPQSITQENLPHDRRRVLSLPVQLLSGWSKAQLWLLVGMMPMLLATFQQVSLVAPLANLVAVPLIGFGVVPLVLLALLCWMLELALLSDVLLVASSWLLDLTWWWLQQLASLPGAVIRTAQPPWWLLVSGLAGTAILAMGTLLPSRCLGLLLLLLMFSPGKPKLAAGEFSVTQLDVGQGLATVILTRSHLLVYDSGAAFPGGFNLGKAVVIPFLRSLYTRRIDTLVLSHADNDHAGGASAIIEAFPTTRILNSFSGTADAPAGSEPCYAGQRWSWDGVLFTVLGPGMDQVYRGNNSSCVLRISSENGSVLLTGDIEAATELRLQAEYRPGVDEFLDVDLLMAAHHGSKTSSSESFLDAASPRLGIVSSGYLNRFGHPHPVVVERFRQRAVPLLNTAAEGAISVLFAGGKMRVQGARNAINRFWLQPGVADFVWLNQHLNEASRQ